MTLKLYAHPLSSYCQKAVVTLYENNTPFEFMMLDAEDPDIFTEFMSLWPIKRFPLLVDDGRVVIEALGGSIVPSQPRRVAVNTCTIWPRPPGERDIG